MWNEPKENARWKKRGKTMNGLSECLNDDDSLRGIVASSVIGG